MINVNQLNFTYTGADKPAVNNLTFSIAPGEIFGFLGPSGAGKSTIQKILIGLLQDYTGSVLVWGQDLQRWGADYYERIGVSFELPNHYLKLTAVENLTYFSALYHGPTHSPQDLLALVGLEADGDVLVGHYSKGMKNRLSVARALVHNPELLFLDEPTSGLDPVNARRIKDLIRAQQQAGKTIFLTTHNMSVAEELCDRVALIVEGKIVLVDSPRRLKMAYGQAAVRIEYQANGRLDTAEFELNNLGHNNRFLHLLRTQPVQTIHTQEATLEDVFIQVTGKSLT
ncbi:MAG: ABC transporter ATP-binding protein [Chloroflexota bacterium]